MNDKNDMLDNSIAKIDQLGRRLTKAIKSKAEIEEEVNK